MVANYAIDEQSYDVSERQNVTWVEDPLPLAQAEGRCHALGFQVRDVSCPWHQSRRPPGMPAVGWRRRASVQSKTSR